MQMCASCYGGPSPTQGEPEAERVVRGAIIHLLAFAGALHCTALPPCWLCSVLPEW
jgi:hypothetical protein